MPTSEGYDPILNREMIIGVAKESLALDGPRATDGPNAFMPSRPYNSDIVKFDVRFPASGLLHGLGRDEDIPDDRQPGISRMTLQAPVWRGHYRFDESQLTQLSRAGENQDTVMTREEILMEAGTWLGRRVRDTKEWTGWQALEDGTLVVNHEDGATTTINYRMPSDLQQTLAGTSKWSDFINSDPLEDLRLMIIKLRGYNTRPAAFWLGANVEGYLLQNARISTLIQNQAGREILSMFRLPDGLLFGKPYFVSDAAYTAEDFVSTAYTGGTSLVVELGSRGQLADVVSGDRIVLGPSTHTTNPRAKESVEVSSISTTTITLSAAATTSFEVGDRVTWHRPFVNPNDIYIMPEDDGEPWVEWWEVPSVFNAPATLGMYAVTEVKLNDVPLRGYVKGGIDGLPIIRRNGRHARIRVA